MKKNNTKVSKIATEIGKDYFSTPSTSFDKQRQVANYDSFDISSEPYRKSTSRVIIRKYTVK